MEARLQGETMGSVNKKKITVSVDSLDRIRLRNKDGGSVGKSSVYQCRRPGFFSRKIPWRRKWQPTPGLLPRKSHGQRSLVQANVHGVTKSWTRLSDFT